MLIVKVPESVSEYFSNMAVEEAVDKLLGNKKQAKNIDDNYTWREVRQFHQAYLSAQICRSSFIVMMLDIRDCLFLDNPEFEIGDTIEDSFPDNFTVEKVWEEEAVFTNCVHADSKLQFMASLVTDDGKLCLDIMLDDDEVIEHQKMIFGKALSNKSIVDDDGNYWFSTGHNLLKPMKEWKDEIDITPIKMALNAFIKNLQSSK